ncbi:hypothetical protein QBC36DRAFT_366608 [Triangularia setosa]|uniref:Uncharacterized protein n=1 Tax=Triangularia setosa TaxID=2587417 RepID=A0AAN7AA65_9PEZI|nr:hypothetical protein QBC36DRAFT_366608 [Podospora setosa]
MDPSTDLSLSNCCKHSRSALAWPCCRATAMTLRLLRSPRSRSRSAREVPVPVSLLGLGPFCLVTVVCATSWARWRPISTNQCSEFRDGHCNCGATVGNEATNGATSPISSDRDMIFIYSLWVPISFHCRTSSRESQQYALQQPKFCMNKQNEIEQATVLDLATEILAKKLGVLWKLLCVKGTANFTAAARLLNSIATSLGQEAEAGLEGDLFSDNWRVILRFGFN